MDRTGLIILVAGILFGVGETAYFGWNRTARSAAEKACDFLALLACGAGAVVILLRH